MCGNWQSTGIETTDVRCSLSYPCLNLVLSHNAKQNNIKEGTFRCEPWRTGSTILTNGRNEGPKDLDADNLVAPTWCLPPPLPLLVAKAGRNHLNEEITPPLPTGIGEQYSRQTL
jgi:hypothetical protein